MKRSEPLLHSQAQGKQQSAEDLILQVYEELRHLAAYRMANERPGHTLQATALVHEAYLRLSTPDSNTWKGRRHFFGAAAEAMRRILVESARRKLTERRGGAPQRVELKEIDLLIQPPSEDVLAVDEALDALAQVDAEAAELVKLRFFIGLTHAQAAETLGLSRSAADRTWVFARAWLFDQIRR